MVLQTALSSCAYRVVFFGKTFFPKNWGIGLFFSDDQHYVRRPCGVCLTEQFFYFFIFFENPFWAKLTKNGQK